MSRSTTRAFRIRCLILIETLSLMKPLTHDMIMNRVDKIRLSCLALLIALGYPPSANANFVIRLKNGSEYVTSHYRQEGRQLVFDAYGGVFGVEQSFVAKVERSSAARPIQTDNHLPVSTTIPRTEKDPTGSSTTSPPKVEAKEVPNDPITTEFNQLSERTKKVQGLLTSEIRVLMKDITDFKNKLTKDSKLFIKYGREFNDAHEISDVVEAALRARTQ